MDPLSVAGFALNVISYLKNNPIDFETEAEQPPAAVEQPVVSRSSAVEPEQKSLPALYAQRDEPRYPQGVSRFHKKTSVNQSGQISMAKIQPEGTETTAQPMKQATRKGVAAHGSGVDRNGRYFFRKRDL